MRLLYSAFYIIHSALAACVLCAQTAQPRYLTAAPESIIAAIPPPPADDSPAGRADVETMLQLQKDRTPAQVARAIAVEKQDIMTLGVTVFGPKFTRENLPFTHAFLMDATVERRVVARLAKTYWNRPRPFERGLGIEKCVPGKSEGTSYPSGHSSGGSLWEILFSEAMPEYKTRFTAARREIMWCRVLAGVHYPSDTHAGCVLGHLVAREMLKNQTTRDAIAGMRAEILAFLDKNPDARPVAN